MWEKSPRSAFRTQLRELNLKYFPEYKIFDLKDLQVKNENVFRLSTAAPTAAVHGFGAEDGLQQRSAGAQPHPAWRLLPQGGAGGEQEELPEESAAHGGAGGGAEGETPIVLTEIMELQELAVKNTKFFLSLLVFPGRKNSE